MFDVKPIVKADFVGCPVAFVVAVRSLRYSSEKFLWGYAEENSQTFHEWHVDLDDYFLIMYKHVTIGTNCLQLVVEETEIQVQVEGGGAKGGLWVPSKVGGCDKCDGFSNHDYDQESDLIPQSLGVESDQVGRHVLNPRLRVAAGVRASRYE